jgi:hypothetical protein
MRSQAERDMRKFFDEKLYALIEDFRWRCDFIDIEPTVAAAMMVRALVRPAMAMMLIHGSDSRSAEEISEILRTMVHQVAKELDVVDARIKSNRRSNKKET